MGKIAQLLGIPEKTFDIPMQTVTDTCWMRVRVEDDALGDDKEREFTIGLFGEVQPKTVENFKGLCIGTEITGPDGETVKLHYKGSFFHRIINGFVAQGGQLPYKGTFIDTSIWGGFFDDENMKIRHKRKHLVSMANSGPNTNGSQFFITYDKLNSLNKKHTVFGEIIEGKEIVQFI